MHDGEVDIDVALVERLVAGQFPRETNPGFVALAARTVREIVSGSDLARTQH